MTEIEIAVRIVQRPNQAPVKGIVFGFKDGTEPQVKEAFYKMLDSLVDNNSQINTNPNKKEELKNIQKEGPKLSTRQLTFNYPNLAVETKIIAALEPWLGSDRTWKEILGLTEKRATSTVIKLPLVSQHPVPVTTQSTASVLSLPTSSTQVDATPAPSANISVLQQSSSSSVSMSSTPAPTSTSMMGGNDEKELPGGSFDAGAASIKLINSIKAGNFEEATRAIHLITTSIPVLEEQAKIIAAQDIDSESHDNPLTFLLNNFPKRNENGEPNETLQQKSARLALITKLAQFSGSVHQQNNHGNALHLAAANGLSEEVQILLANGADIFSVNSSGATPLLLAAFCGQPTVTRILLEKVDQVLTQAGAKESEVAISLDNYLAKTIKNQHGQPFNAERWAASHGDQYGFNADIIGLFSTLRGRCQAILGGSSAIRAVPIPPQPSSSSQVAMLSTLSSQPQVQPKSSPLSPSTVGGTQQNGGASISTSTHNAEHKKSQLVPWYKQGSKGIHTTFTVVETSIDQLAPLNTTGGSRPNFSKR